ncbi:hypothetical protein [Sulfitobacter sp.]|jgi:hypothetical protein|uniref:hypothetical protein n=1 Tax=Sulfitobacter sp. TaxID=1903071 RepID=UPI003564E410|tara:strand:+ start:1153 stop:1392 length:240 start_codon:yes stop_codon:yes gene_type:complete|mmetsp:Transcript_19158/g.61295  ORF Transcript_19158/g.61295 Transcript_19158/m.61295 type:complete len:80 (+) Transcript_19158:12-251(+)
MFDEKQKLEISQEELALIEAALHTQSKILGVQASAGGAKALTRLNDIKRVLAKIAQQKPVKAQKPKTGGVFLSMSRMFG